MSSGESAQAKYELLQKLVAEYEYLRVAAQALEEQVRLAEAAQQDLIVTMGSIQELNEKGLNKQLLVPLGSGVMAETVLAKYDKLLVNVGLNIYVKLEPAKVVEYLNGRREFLKGRMDELVRDYSATLQRMGLLEPKINRLVGELQAGQ
ncbi:MAG: prefoldin subunit alpha [Thermoprotei archaeon]